MSEWNYAAFGDNIDVMRSLLPAIFVCAVIASPAYAEPNLERGFDGAVRGCEEWILNPASWAEGIGPFVEAVGLGPQMRLVDRVEEVNLPPAQLRRANRYWRINATANAGYILVVSDQLPMCHITGGGGSDIQPSIESVLSSPNFKRRWQSESTIKKHGMVTTMFRNRTDPAFSMNISRANGPGERLDRVQVLATAIYRPSS